MIKTSVARRYAKALFALLDPQTVEATRVALYSLGRALTESSSLRHVLASPAYGPEDKLEVLAELARRFGCPPIGKNFLAQLVKKNRVGFLPEVAEAFGRLADEAKGTQQVFISSASSLNQSEQDKIRGRMRQLLKRDVEITFDTNTDHLAGMQIRIGNTIVDSTVRGRLTAMQGLLTKE
ncbi:MAG: ATP synthase F1 subunit delta [Nitrospiraceae bacterium]